ncbi:DUF4177 domain-containing protein [Lysinibacillus sp. 54212]|uniref:DUF4177 domain-containing protein n=1 Tax=Lysinibacillus sp. 54212 TaxID=3119829 RepID=UPI002FCA38CB
MNWEYKVINVSSGFWSDLESGVESKLNKYGLEGWELVSAIPILFKKNEYYDGIKNEVESMNLILKRPIR